MDIGVKSYCRLNLLKASVLNFKHLDILWDSIAHPSKRLLSFEFAQSSVFNLQCLNMLQDSIGHPSKMLLSFEFAQSFYIQFRAFGYITGLNWTSE